MLYNRLFTKTHREQYVRSLGMPVDEQRCSGRSTAIALEAVAQAIRNPQQWVAVVDHFYNASQSAHVVLAKQAMEIAGLMNLQYFERDRNLIRSCHMTPNQLELK